MNSSFPNRWSFSYLKFTKYITNIIAEPKYKYGQQEQITVRNHDRSTTLELSVLKYIEYIFSSKLSDDRAYGTLRSVIDAEEAIVTHAVRSDGIAVRYPPTGNEKKIKKKKIEPKLKSKDEHSEEEDVSEKVNQ